MISGTGFKKDMHNKYGLRRNMLCLMGKINEFFWSKDRYTIHMFHIPEKPN